MIVSFGYMLAVIVMVFVITTNRTAAVVIIADTSKASLQRCERPPQLAASFICHAVQAPSARREHGQPMEGGLLSSSNAAL